MCNFQSSCKLSPNSLRVSMVHDHKMLGRCPSADGVSRFRPWTDTCLLRRNATKLRVQGPKTTGQRRVAEVNGCKSIGTPNCNWGFSYS